MALLVFMNLSICLAMGQTTTPFKGNTTLPEYEWRRPDPDEDWETGMWMICTYVLE